MRAGVAHEDCRELSATFRATQNAEIAALRSAINELSVRLAKLEAPIAGPSGK